MTKIFRSTWLLVALILVGVACFRTATGGSDSSETSVEGWRQGVGWGWIWGKNDEVGALNAMRPGSVRQALQIASEGQVYDLGVTYSRNSFKWPGHNAGEVMTYRSPEGVSRQKDHSFADPGVNSSRTRWHSCALFISDNVATQIDGLAHITLGEDNHWYNGFKESDWGGNFGVRKCDATTIPPIVARGVLLDVATARKVDALPAHYGITPVDIDVALSKQGVELRPGDVVLLRTGTLRYWNTEGGEHEKLAEHDSAGLTLEGAKYLVEQYGAMMIGSDTSGLEVGPAPRGSDSFIPVHKYLLVEQGVHIAELHYLEDLARHRVYEFCYMATTNKIAGTTAGFTMRPIAIK